MKLILDVCKDVSLQKPKKENVNIELHLRVPRESKKKKDYVMEVTQMETIKN